MLDVIQFLEGQGRSPALQGSGSPDAYADSVGHLDIGEPAQRALIERDAGALNGLLGGRAWMAMHILAPDGDDEPLQSPDRQDDVPAQPEEPSRETEQPD